MSYRVISREITSWEWSGSLCKGRWVRGRWRERCTDPRWLNHTDPLGPVCTCTQLTFMYISWMLLLQRDVPTKADFNSNFLCTPGVVAVLLLWYLASLTMQETQMDPWPAEGFSASHSTPCSCFWGLINMEKLWTGASLLCFTHLRKWEGLCLVSLWRPIRPMLRHEKINTQEREINDSLLTHRTQRGRRSVCGGVGVRACAVSTSVNVNITCSWLAPFLISVRSRVCFSAASWEIYPPADS